MNPIALVVTTERWFSTARLVMGLANAGFSVEALCAFQHPLAKTTVVSRHHAYVQHAPLSSLRDSIVAAKPDLIVPADDIATHRLHQLHAREFDRGRSGQAICALIERSLGAPAYFPALEKRAATLQLAAQAGVRVPETRTITSQTDLAKWLACFGPRTVLKADNTTGGRGVRIVGTPREAKRAFHELRITTLSRRSLVPSFLSMYGHFSWPKLFGKRTPVTAQAFITGCDAITEVACWQGQVLASIQFQVVSKQYASGPASVVRLIENAEIADGVAKVARRLSLSGLHGFDFILEEGTGNAHLIEVNPRATQVNHLTFGEGRDLPAALYAAVTQGSIQVAPRVTENPTIALFPQEWTKNRTSSYLESSYQDVPWGEPEFVRACLSSCSNENA